MKRSKEYLIEINETLSRTIRLEADTVDEALDSIKKLYYGGDIVLDTGDFAEVGFVVKEDVVVMDGG